MKNLKSLILFAVAVFSGAFLLFQIQPLIGKYLLPWFGGAPAVWMTCLMFFQLVLLGGYAYAHLLQRFSFRRQAAIHVGLLLAALVVAAVLAAVWNSPILPDMSWRPSGTGNPTADILRLLLVSIGLSYFLLSSSASLLQAWVHRVHPDQSPYLFYVVSNVASLLALLSYPFLIEPVLTIDRQAWIWSGGFLFYVLFCATCASKIWKLVSGAPAAEQSSSAGNPVRAADAALWIMLSFCGVLALMSVTNRMTQDVPPVPFLWILPLSLYLLSYIIGFMKTHRVGQEIYLYLLLCAAGAVWYLQEQGLGAEIRLQIGLYSFILLAVCLFCHSTLYRARPEPKHLTGFYLCISIGGALGGLFTVLAAPLLFNSYLEYPLMLVLVFGLGAFQVYRDKKLRRLFGPVRHLFPPAVLLAALYLAGGALQERKTSVFMERSFFGAVRVELELNNNIPIYSLMHGKINHGMQIDHPRFRRRPTTYFTAESGVGRAMTLQQSRKPALRVGVLGLGIGTLAAYGREGDTFRMYEIDPVVIELAENSPWFSYLRDSNADVQIVAGDGRLSLERELHPASGGEETVFDLLVLDAFSGDSPPAHLLTLEAFALYLEHLAEDGILAVNISNRYLDLLPVLRQVSLKFNLPMAYIQSTGDKRISADAQWVLLSRDEQLLRQPAVARADSLPQTFVRDIRPWTDRFSNLLSVIK